MLIRLLQLFDKVSKIKRLRHHFLIWCPKKPIDISANKGTPCITYRHPISINHWDYLEYALFPESISDLVFT
jgi:hypothetical protein